MLYRWFWSRTPAERVLIRVDAWLAIATIVLFFITALVRDWFEWESFVPDLVVAIVTGLIVGALLARSQREIEHSRRVWDSHMAWRSFEPKVRATPRLIGDLAADLEKGHETLGALVGEARPLYKRLDNKPLDQWHEDTNAFEVRELIGIRDKYLRLLTETPVVDALIESEARHVLEMRPDSGSAHLSYVIACATRLLLDRPLDRANLPGNMRSIERFELAQQHASQVADALRDEPNVVRGLLTLQRFLDHHASLFFLQMRDDIRLHEEAKAVTRARQH